MVSRLPSVPFALANVYKAILNDAPTSRFDNVWRLLRWLAFSKRTFKLAELEAALREEVQIS